MTAFAGLRLVDFTQGRAGPMASMLIGDFDAEIIKVEPPAGDHMKDHPGYQAWNRNKQILQLDLDRPEDLARARALIAGADVAVFDHTPGRLEPLGLDAASLTEAFPSLIHVWMPPYGTSGPWSQLPAHHSLLSALTGVAFRQGAYSDQPVHLILPLGHYGQAVMGAAAIGAALHERSQSGRGQAVTVSGLHGISEVAGPLRVLAQPPLPRGAPQGASPSYRLYECGDGQWFFMATLFMPFYRKAIEALGLVEHWELFLMDPFLAREVLMAIFKTRSREDWLAVLKGAGVPCAPVGQREDWFQSEAIGDAGMKVSFDHPDLGQVSMPNLPARLSTTPGTIRGLPVPAAGIDWPVRSQVPTGTGPSKPLGGIRVLDMGTVIAGAHAGGVLANLGADVFKIEPVEGDPFRSDGGPFLVCNRGKRGLGIDLKAPGAKEMFFDLVRQADVILDNYRFGVRARLGIDYAVLKAINPKIISCSINAYGDKGPRAPLPGFDPLLQAEGGMMAAQGGAPEPVLHTIAVNDVATAGIVAFGVIAALNARNRTGEGQEVVTSLLAQSLTYQIGEITTYEGRPANDVGDTDCLGVRALHRYYRCRDGWIAMVVDTEPQAEDLIGLLGLTFSPGEALQAPRDGAVAMAIEAALSLRDRDETLQRMISAGLAVAPCLRGYESFDDDWLWENGFFEMWTHPRLGEAVSVRAFADFSRTPGGFRYPVPEAGEHSRTVLAEFGLAADRIDQLIADGAVFEPAASRAHLRDGGAALFTQ